MLAGTTSKQSAIVEQVKERTSLIDDIDFEGRSRRFAILRGSYLTDMESGYGSVRA